MFIDDMICNVDDCQLCWEDELAARYAKRKDSKEHPARNILRSKNSSMESPYRPWFSMPRHT